MGKIKKLKTTYIVVLITIKNFFTKNKFGIQCYSFLKTYLTVFIALYIKGVVDTKEEGVDIILLNAPVIITSAKWSLIAVLRNFYKVLTE